MTTIEAINKFLIDDMEEKKMNESSETYTFTKLFKEVEIANKINKEANLDRVVYVQFSDPDAYQEGRFTSYKDFKKYLSEEYNSYKEILNSEFILDHPFEVTFGYFGDTAEYTVSLVIGR